ncbi:MAG: Ldh family oxidoreductase [Candidatus Latescibacteria bacterium]|nr:Ldh family oxidoreductase [Candidatus Latescibacterota bacterium]
MNLPPTEFIRVPADQLRALSRAVFEKVGVAGRDAELIAGLLVDTDLRGVFSHGTRCINGYARAFLGGQLNPTPRIEVVRDEPSTAVVDGDGGLGHVATVRATELAIAKAKANGVGAVVVRNHGHFGGAGKYTRMALRQGCAAFCVSGHTIEPNIPDQPQWNPIGNPPMSFAFPAGGEAPLVLDMGTSFFEPEHFPALFAQVPAAFFKSIGLVAVAQLFGGVMAGMMAAQFRPENRSYAAAGYGAFIAVVDVARFVPVEQFKAEVDHSMQRLHQLPPLPGYARYDLPGGLEWEQERRWAVEGIPLGREHQHSLEEIAGQLALAVPWK